MSDIMHATRIPIIETPAHNESSRTCYVYFKSFIPSAMKFFMYNIELKKNDNQGLNEIQMALVAFSFEFL